jgi:hypothetical protein
VIRFFLKGRRYEASTCYAFMLQNRMSPVYSHEMFGGGCL